MSTRATSKQATTACGTMHHKTYVVLIMTAQKNLLDEVYRKNLRRCSDPHDLEEHSDETGVSRLRFAERSVPARESTFELTPETAHSGLFRVLRRQSDEFGSEGKRHLPRKLH